MRSTAAYCLPGPCHLALSVTRLVFHRFHLSYANREETIETVTKRYLPEVGGFFPKTLASASKSSCRTVAAFPTLSTGDNINQVTSRK